MVSSEATTTSMASANLGATAVPQCGADSQSAAGPITTTGRRTSTLWTNNVACEAAETTTCRTIAEIATTEEVLLETEAMAIGLPEMTAVTIAVKTTNVGCRPRSSKAKRIVEFAVVATCA